MDNPPNDDTQRAMDKLAGLVRLQDKAANEDRPAMFHACQLLIHLKLGVLQHLAKPGGATPAARDVRPIAGDDRRER